MAGCPHLLDLSSLVPIAVWSLLRVYAEKPSQRKNTMNLEKVMTLLRSRGLEGIAEPCLQFRTQPIQEHELSLGSSKFGGSPELPIEVPWPTWNGWPLDFLLQLDCSEIPPHLTSDLLPKTGWLYFFYDIESHTWGYDPSDRGSWRVLFFEGDRKALVRRRHPDYANARFIPFRNSTSNLQIRKVHH